MQEMTSEKKSGILKRIRDAIQEFPEMVSGEGRFDLALMRTFPNNVVCKVGAEAIQGIGFKEPSIGIVVKIHDGNPRALLPVCVEVLVQLGLVDINKAEHLQSFYKPDVRNSANLVTGYIKAEFSLKKV